MTQDQAFGMVPTLLSGAYRLDPQSTTVHFSARKFGLFTIRGTMRLIEGAFTVANPVELSTIHAVLAADSFATPMAKRNEHVKGKKLLDVASFPTIEFMGTGLTPSPMGWNVRGTLAVHGQRQESALTIDEVSERGELVHIGARTQVDRRDFGVTGMRVAAGPLIDIRIEVVASRI